ncbi:uncharacterized protein [Eleutherodactylus coqui]|uniref:uncharacterized protein isoform X2 n=1 Tax=Eleutherodactylus coqui TaxID=57060 RepID=UPI0034625E07
MAAPDICAFCKRTDADIAGTLQRTPDGSIVAHYKCMLYSPLAISQNSQDATEGFDFDIQSVRAEIERGQRLRCYKCRKFGATVGCDVKKCKRTYHFPCLKEAGGSPCKDKYVVYCYDHKKERARTVPKYSGGKPKNYMQKDRKRILQKKPGRQRKNVQKRHCDNDLKNVQMRDHSEENFLLRNHLVAEETEEALPSTSGQQKNLEKQHCDNADMKNVQINEQSEVNFVLPIHSVIEVEETEEPLPSTSGQQKFYTWFRCSPMIITGKILRKNAEKQHCDNDMMNVQINEQSEENFVVPIHSVIEAEETEEPLPSTSGQHITSDMSYEESEESDSILTPKVNSVFSLSGFPKKKKCVSKRKPNKKLEEVMHDMSSQDKEALSQMYSEFEGSQTGCTIEMAEAQDNQNDKMATEDVQNSDVSDTSMCSNNVDKTPERLPDIAVPLSPSGCSTKDKAFTEEQPLFLQDEEIPDKMSDSPPKKKKTTLGNLVFNLHKIKLPTQSSNSIIKGISTHDASSYSVNSVDIPDIQSPTPSNSTDRPIMPSMTSITAITANERVAHPLGWSNDLNLATEQILSTNIKGKLAPEPVSCADSSTFTRPDASVGCSLDSLQPAEDLVAEPGTILCSPLTLAKDGSETEVSTSVSDSLLEKMESDISTSQCDNRDIPGPNYITTLQNGKKRHNRGNPFHVISPQQITALSRKLGPLSEQLKSIVPQINSTIESSRRNTNNDAGQSGDEKDPVYQETRKSITRKRKLFQEQSPDVRVQQTEENLPKQLEIPEQQDEHNVAENATPGPVESESTSEHQSGSSSIATPHRRLYGSHFSSKRRLTFQYNRAGDQDDIDGFGQAVAGQCRRMPEDRQARYMSYVLASADLFYTPQTLPPLDILISNLRTLLENSQPLAPCGSESNTTMKDEI